VAGKNDTLNLVLPLPDVPLDGISHQAHHRGIDFIYDPSPSPEGRLSLWFHRSDLSDPVVRQVLKPFDDDNDDGDDSDMVLAMTPSKY
jgi:glycosidase